ncbi:helix-turn-helix domain-containing protein [Clostridium sporogenes]|uniref:helix-turn-helix transcriptional regulator n=1 Tax=Clostridium sporogenes TaxID=1509 RepID=UPI0013D468D2|nr:helix-turn-helix domain-containing protein [Clostridium botulinum]NFE81254.1 helix-turn-helix domain-containing protein [Clostridium sporogenes]NFG68674.1 helix-turn-helix domain-containing protein [Clostridium sporogenes]
MALLKTNLKEFREKTNMKQRELDDLVRVRRETIMHLENGKYNSSLKLTVDIAKILRCRLKICLNL